MRCRKTIFWISQFRIIISKYKHAKMDICRTGITIKTIQRQFILHSFMSFHDITASIRAIHSKGKNFSAGNKSYSNNRQKPKSTHKLPQQEQGYRRQVRIGIDSVHNLAVLFDKFTKKNPKST